MTARADSDPPPSYLASTNYRLGPHEFTQIESFASSNSHLTASDLSALGPPPRTSAPSDLLASNPPNHIRRATTNHRPTTATPDSSRNFDSISNNYLTSRYGMSDLSTKTSSPAPRSSDMTFPSTSPISTMNSTTDEKTIEMAKKLISNSPELRNNIYSLLGSAVAAIEAGQPQVIKDKDAKIEDLQKQLLDALNYGNEKARKVEKLEADLKVATDTGLYQVDTLEDLHKKLKKAEETEKNIRKGNLALHKELNPMRTENVKMKRQLKEADNEIKVLMDKVQHQAQRLELYHEREQHTEFKALRMQNDLQKLEQENHLLVLKGEQMSGKLLAVAEQWQEPGVGGGMKRQASEILDDGERMRRYSRLTR